MCPVQEQSREGHRVGHEELLSRKRGRSNQGKAWMGNNSDVGGRSDRYGMQSWSVNRSHASGVALAWSRNRGSRPGFC